MTFVLVMVIASLLIGLSKGGLGGPVPVALVVPLLSAIMPVPQAVGLTIPLLIFADLFALRLYRGDWAMRYIRLMLPAAVIGVIAGAFLLASLPDALLRRVLGLFTLGVILYKLAGDHLNALTYRPRNWHGYVAGGTAGFGSALANIGAPPFTAYMLLQRESPRVFIGTTTLFFAIVNLLKLPGYLTTGVIDLHSLASTAWTLPLIPLGVWLGRKAILRINPHAFERLMMVLLLGASLSLLFGTPPA